MDTAEVIREVPFFKAARDEDIAALQEICNVKGALAGTKLFDQGEPSDSFFIVVAGRVDIRVLNDAGTNVYSMAAGDFFGEMGVIRNSPRSGTAFVAEDSVFLQIMKYDFDRLMAVNKFFSGMVMEAFLHRTQTTLGSRIAANAPPEVSSPSQAPAAPPPERKGKVITVFSPIGGAGTTVLAANIAMKIKDFTKSECLVMDACYQFGVLGTILGARSSKNIVEMTEGIQIRAHTVEQYAVKTPSGLDFFPPPRNPEDGARFTPEVVSHILNGAAARWDHVVVDTSSVMEEPNLTILDLSDQIYMVLVPEVTAIRRLLAWLALMQKLGYPPERIHIILNKHLEDSDISPDLIAKKLQRRLLGVIPYDYENMGRSVNTGNLVVEGNPLCDVSVEISNMVRESLFPREEAEEKRSGFLYRLFGG